ncbi:DHS-like NAD/FAD-binding domain-containing protein, partial [Auricularia subglabra TFB-10046 SS5]
MVVTYAIPAPDHDSETQLALRNLSILVGSSRRIVIVTGAGVSRSSGIPDFRSANGLYSLAKKNTPRTIRGSDLFDASIFRDGHSASLFYSSIAELKAVIDKAKPSPTHHFMKAMLNEGRLLRVYTQNIDGFETQCGLKSNAWIEPPSSPFPLRTVIDSNAINVVQLHGDIHRVRCIICSASYHSSQEFANVFRSGGAPKCPECEKRCADRIARSARPIRTGTLRPDIILYNESHPDSDDVSAFCELDLVRRPDLLLVMGTSLKAYGIKTLVKDFARAVHGNSSGRNKPQPRVIFVNETPPLAEWRKVFDVHISGTTDDWVKLVRE